MITALVCNYFLKNACRKFIKYIAIFKVIIYNKYSTKFKTYKSCIFTNTLFL